MKTGSKLLIGITGGTGCGQSTVADFFTKWGAEAVNADETAKKVIATDPKTQACIRATFGDNVFASNGELNRKLLAKMVFNDDRKLRQLNSIVHPRMAESIIEQIEGARKNPRHKLILVDAALIFEANLDQMFDKIIVVAARSGVRIERLAERDGLTEAEARMRMQRQIPIEDKAKWADIVIHNNTTLEQLESRCKKVFDQLLNQRKRPPRKKVNKN